jgi:iron complex outermembrane recepter protein
MTGYTDASFDFDQDGDLDSGVTGNIDRATRAARFDYSNETKQISQEIRYVSDFEGPLNFKAGALYWDEKADQIARSINVFCVIALPPGPFGNIAPLAASCGNLQPNQVLGQLTAIPRLNAREIEHASAFGSLDWEITSRVKASFEARYSDETETVQGVNCGAPTLAAGGLFPGSPPVPCNDSSLRGFQVFGPSINLLYPYFTTDPSFGRPATPPVGVTQAPGIPVTADSDHQYTSGRVTLEFRATDDALLYVNWARGVKPGGVSTVTGGSWQDADYDGDFDEFTFKDETITEYELGAKLTFLENRLRLNPAVFFIDYEDKQVGAQLVTPSGIPSGRLLNAGQAEVRGAELDAEFAPNDSWLLRLNYAFLDTEFTDFPFSSASPTDASRFGSCERRLLTDDGIDGRRLCFINLKGNELERAPRHSIVAQARYTRPMAAEGKKFFIEGDVQAQSERYVDIWNQNKLDDYVLGNLRFGVTSPQWDALIFIDNLFDDSTVLSANPNPGDVAQSILDPTNFAPADTIGVSLPDPRIIGVRFNYRFGNN